MDELRALMAVVVSLLVLTLAPFAHAEVIDIDVRQVRPTQVEVGRAVVNEIVDRWTAVKMSENLSWQEVAERMMADRTTAAIRAPDATVMATDGHHYLDAMFEMSRRAGVAFKARIDVTVDHQKLGRSHEEFVHNFKGQFPRELRNLPPEERFEHLSQTFADVRDNPMRSLAAKVFFYGAEPEHFVDYIEFEVGEELEARVLKHLKTDKVPADRVQDPELIHWVRKQVFTDRRMRAFLVARIRPGSEEAALRTERRKFNPILRTWDTQVCGRCET